jgi:hypothetical protein
LITLWITTREKVCGLNLLHLSLLHQKTKQYEYQTNRHSFNGNQRKVA